MEIIQKATVELLDTAPSYHSVLKTFNIAARNCYKSLNEDTDNMEAAENLAHKLIKLGHGSPLEMNSVPVKITADRVLLGQLTRHRLLSFAVESMRYCNYTLGKFNKSVRFIVPADITDDTYEEWRATCLVAEAAYFTMVDKGLKPETARSILPMCTATDIVVAGNIREWRHVLSLRCSKKAQTDIRNLCLELLKLLYYKYPIFFVDLFKEHFDVEEDNMHV